MTRAVGEKWAKSSAIVPRLYMGRFMHDSLDGLHLLPFSTFASITELGLEVHVYCPRCYALRKIDPLAHSIRDREFAGARFICHRCGSRGLAQLQPPNPQIAGGPVALLFLWCNNCLWEAKALPIEQTPWSAVMDGRGFLCPGCRRSARNHLVHPQGPGGIRITSPPP